MQSANPDKSDLNGTRAGGSHQRRNRSDTRTGDASCAGFAAVRQRSVVLYGARRGKEHPFARETRELLQSIERHRSFVVYSQPESDDQPGNAFDVRGHLGAAALRELNVPRHADFYLCGPAAFLKDLTAALFDCGVASSRIRSEVFGKGYAFKPGIKSGP
jgi:ferredoxin-NADP reductase